MKPWEELLEKGFAFEKTSSLSSKDPLPPSLTASLNQNRNEINFNWLANYSTLDYLLMLKKAPKLGELLFERVHITLYKKHTYKLQTSIVCKSIKWNTCKSVFVTVLEKVVCSVHVLNKIFKWICSWVNVACWPNIKAKGSLGVGHWVEQTRPHQKARQPLCVLAMLPSVHLCIILYIAKLVSRYDNFI